MFRPHTSEAIINQSIAFIGRFVKQRAEGGAMASAKRPPHKNTSFIYQVRSKRPLMRHWFIPS